MQLIDLSNNDLNSFILPNSFGALTYIYLDDNSALTDFVTLDLKKLNILSIKNTRLKKLPENLFFGENIECIYAEGNAPKNIPNVILEGYRKNCLEDARKWFEELRDYPSEKNKVIKLMLTGNGNAGKSSILCALKNGKCAHDHSSTHGIQIDIVDKGDIQYNAWDFGGQEVYHGTHRLFMASRALQALLFDPKTEALAQEGTRIPDRISNETTLNHPIKYWYETVKELSPDSAFFIVQNKKDIPTLNQEDDTIRRYALQKPKTKFVHVSAKEGIDIDELAFQLQKGAKDLPDFDMPMPISWLKVRDFFINNLTKEEDSQKILTKEAFRALCIACKVREVNIDLLFTYLHHNGFIYYHPNLGDKIIADQRWALEAIYKPLDREAEHYAEFKEDLKGKIRVRRLFQIFGNKYTIDEKWLFLDFMKSCGLCFQLNNKPHQETKSESDIYIFPEFLAFGKPNNVQTDWQKAQNVHVLRYKFEWLNYFVIQSFISSLGRKTETDNIWRNGIHVSTTEGWFKVELDYEQKALLLSIEEAAMGRWLEPILEELKVGENKSGWDKSTDGQSFIPFEFEPWKNGHKQVFSLRKIEENTPEKEELKPIKEKLPDVEQSFNRQVILFLAANPTAAKLSFGNEHTHIAVKLKEHRIKDAFEIIPKFGTTSDNMVEAINDNCPDIVHFVGHGKEENLGNGSVGGLVFHNSDYQGDKIMDAGTLNRMFRRIKNNHPQLKIIVLSACFSEPQAQAISQNNLYAIGSNDEISSFAARMFAVGFYRQYAITNDIKKGVDTGLTQALAEDENVESLINLFHNGNRIPV